MDMGLVLIEIEKYFTENKIIEHTNRMFQNATDKIDTVTKNLAGQLDEMHDSLENSFNESDFKNKIEYICTYMRDWILTPMIKLLNKQQLGSRIWQIKLTKCQRDLCIRLVA